MNNREINRLLRREFRGPAWVLLGYFALMNLLVMVDFGAVILRQALSAVSKGDFFFSPDVQALMESAWGYCAAAAAGLLVLLAGKGRYFWRAQVLRKNRPMALGTFLSFLLLCMGVQLLNSLWLVALEAVMNLFGRSALDTLEAVSGASSTVSMFLYASVIAPVTEELIFRGYIQRSLDRYGRRFAIIGSAFLFGMFHGNLLQIPYAFLMGLLLGYVTAQYHIGWAVGLHLFNNLILADLLTRATSSLPEDVVGTINLVLLGGAAAASLIILLVNRSKIREYFREEWVDGRCLACFFTNSGVIVFSVLMTVNALLTLLL